MLPGAAAGMLGAEWGLKEAGWCGRASQAQGTAGQRQDGAKMLVLGVGVILAGQEEVRPMGRALNDISQRAGLSSVMGGPRLCVPEWVVWPTSVEFCWFDVNFLLMYNIGAEKHIQGNSISKRNVFM